MGHVVLLGDSIFDNAAYVRGRPAVIDQVRSGLPQGWRASLNAVDGHTTRGVYGQLERLPGDASHLVLSVGGNDALGQAAVLNARAGSVADAVRLLADLREGFDREYTRLLAAISGRGLPPRSARSTIRATPSRRRSGSTSPRSACSMTPSSARPTGPGSP